MADSDVTTAVCLQYVIIAAASIVISRKRRRRRQYWIKPWIRMRNVCGAYHSLFEQLLTTDAQSFQNFMRMDVVAFEDVLSRVEARLIKNDTKMRKSISPRERLCIVIRYLATGMQYYDRPHLYALQ